jgi:hypothetical protein
LYGTRFPSNTIPGAATDTNAFWKIVYMPSYWRIRHLKKEKKNPPPMNWAKAMLQIAKQKATAMTMIL